MSNWQRIREARTDLTNHVVHLTRFVVDGDKGRRDVKEGRVRLKEIIRSGYLLPTTAHRITRNKSETPRYGDRTRPSVLRANRLNKSRLRFGTVAVQDTRSTELLCTRRICSTTGADRPSMVTRHFSPASMMSSSTVG